ncbi:MAG TPA: sodium:solute symporter [Gemmatimonadaceae bacterium]|nr:sodium:solute symporter [Gemmatimonadaceae bacterium]
MHTGFSALDLAVLVLYVAATSWLGAWLGRSQKDAKDYFLADGALPWWAICFSIVATETSALTLISIPGLAYTTNWGFLQIACGYLIGRVVVSAVLLPRYYAGELVTAYAFLEKRFGSTTRRFASVTFMVTRTFADSVRVFATAIPLALILGPAVPEGWGTPSAIMLLGACTVMFTYWGGTKSVVWTDVVQTSVYLVAGLAAVVLIGNGVEGGWSAILSRAGDADKLRIVDTQFVLGSANTLWAGLIGGAFLSMASHGADQLIVQRLLAAGSLAKARRALIVSGFAVIFQFAFFLLIGTGLWAFYDARTFASGDSVFPEFIVNAIPSGLKGLVVAAILAASTIASSLNALAAATVHDIWLPLKGGRADDPATLQIAKRFTLMWAAILIGGAFFYRQQGTPVVTIALGIASFTYGGLLGGFFLGLLWERARQRDAIVGMSVAICIMAVIVFRTLFLNWIPALEPVLSAIPAIAWPWYVLIGSSITLVTGILFSTLFPSRTQSPAR